MPPSQRRSSQSRKRGSAPNTADNQQRIKAAKKNDGLKHRYASDTAMAVLKHKVTHLPQLDECKKLTGAEMNECVVEVMRFLLAQNQSKPMVPVSAAAISKVLKELNVKAAGTTKHVIARAHVRFMGLGFDIAEAGTGYLLRSFVPVEFRTQYLIGKHEKSMHGLRLVVSMYLHTNGGKASSDALRSFLERFGLTVSLKRQHEVASAALVRNKEQFGFENPVQTLVDQKFLKKNAEKELDGGTDEVYSLGDAQTGAATEVPEGEMQENLRDLMEI